MAAPLLTVAGSALALAGSPLGKVAIALASLVLLTPLLRNWNERRSASAALLAGGAAAWLAGNLLWLGGWPIPLVVWWWRAFLLLSIAGDRLALAGLEAGGGRPRRGAPRALWLCVLYLFAVSLLAGLILPALGATMIGLAMVVLAACLLASDRTARRELADRGAARYTGLGVLVAYGWLAAGGALVMILLAVLPAMTLGRSEWLEYLPGAGPLYDAALHAAFVGFALGMVFAHAPRVFPRFLGRPLTFTRAFYLPWTLLQLTLVARIVADIAGSGTLRPWAGAGNALAIALFALTMAIAVARGTPSR